MGHWVAFKIQMVTDTQIDRETDRWMDRFFNEGLKHLTMEVDTSQSTACRLAAEEAGCVGSVPS